MNSVKGWFAEMQVCNMSRWEGSGITFLHPYQLE